MIKSLHIANFQSHEASELELAPGLNVILGQTDSGKTAILRALHWAYANRPSGEAFRSSFADKGEWTGVGLTMDDHLKVVRIRGDKENYYEIYNVVTNDCLHKFKALGTAVPEEISEIFNLTDLNWQMQLDPPFLLSCSPGEVARRLNEIVNLDVIDTTLSNLSSLIRQNTASTKTEETSIAKQVEELADYEYLDQMEEDVGKLEEREEKWLRLGEEYEEIVALLDKSDRLEKKLAGISVILPAEDEVDRLIGLCEELGKLERGRAVVCATLVEIQGMEEKILLAGEELDDLQQQFKRSMPEICPLCESEVK